MTVSPLRGRRSPIAGYLPPLMAVVALALGRRTSARTS